MVGNTNRTIGYWRCWRGLTLGAAISLFVAAGARATDFPETEGNDSKAAADANGTIVMVAGDTITGLSTGSSTTTPGNSSADYFRVKTGPLTLGIYVHRLTITTAGTTGHTGTIRGLTQTSGSINPGTDAAIQTSSTLTTPPRHVAWYGFGKEEEIYYRVTGGASTLANYVATLTTDGPISPTTIGPFVNGTITISTENQTTADTEIFVFDSNLDPVPTFLNDDTFNGTTTRSTLTRTFTNGTYYLLVSSFNSCTNEASPTDDDSLSGSVMDFAASFVRSSSSTSNADWDFTVSDSNGVQTFTNQSGAGLPYQVNWYTFVVQTPMNPPPNDNCANASAIANGATLGGTTFLATNDGSATCDPGGAGSRDVWYSFAAAGSGTLNVDTCGSTIDTVIAVYSGTCGSLTELACNEDCGGTPCSGTHSCASIAASAGTYLIRVSDKGLGADGGEFSIHAALVPEHAFPCGAITIPSTPFTTSVDNSQSPDFGDVSCNTSANDGAFPVWFTYTPGATCTMQIRETSTQNVDISVYTGPNCNSLTEVLCTTADSTTVGMTGGTQYWILLSLSTLTPPTVQMAIEFNCVTPAANDTACTATVIDLTTPPFNDSVDNSTASPDPDVACNTALATFVGYGIWYTYTPTSDCAMELDETGSQGIVWGVFTGPDCNTLTEYFCSPTEQNDRVDMFAGTQYWILVGVDSSAPTIPTSSLSVSFDCHPYVAGDACPSAVEITSLPFSATVDSTGLAPNMPGSPCDSGVGNTQNDFWYKYTATQNCVMVVHSTATSNDVILTVWQGPNCSNKTLVACSDSTTSTSSPGSHESVRFDATSGTTYWFQFGSSGTTVDGSPTDVIILCDPVPANDVPCGATVITSTPATFTDNNALATHDTPNFIENLPPGVTTPLCNDVDSTAVYFGVWYTYTPTADCTMVISETSGQDVNVGAYVGTCNGLTQIDCTGAAFEAMSVGLTANTQYWFLIGTFTFSPPPIPPLPMEVTFDCRPAPVNDLCQNPINLNNTGVPYNEQVDVAAATHDIDMSGSCNASGATLSSNGVWYEYTPAADCTLLVTESSSLNACIAIYTGPDCQSLAEQTCTTNEAITWPLLAGTRYLILVALGTANPGLSDPTTLMDITLDCANPPANDQPCGATVIGATPYSVSQSIALATNDVDTLCNSTSGTQETQKGVWWQYTPASDCMAIINETSSIDVTINVFTGPDCNSLAEQACTSNDHFGFPMTGGTTYWILIGMFSNTPSVPTANLAMSFNCVPNTPPANDMPCGATVISSVPFNDSPVIATATADPDVGCNVAAATSVPFGVWYQYTPTVNCALLMSENSTLNVIWAVYTGGDCGSLSEAFCSGTETNVQFQASAGITYWILVGLDTATPVTPGLPLSINIDCPQTLSNETCDTAAEITSLPFTINYNSFIQDGDPPAGSCNEFGQTQELLNSVWFKWTAPINCQVTLFIQGPPSPSDPMCPVYVGNDCGVCTATGCSGLTEIHCINRAAGDDGPISLVFNATAGETYWFHSGDSGTIDQGGPTTFMLSGDCGPACATCPGDMTGESALDGRDVSNFAACYIAAAGGPPTSGCGCANINGDAVVDGTDLTQFVNVLLSPPPCP